MSRPIRFLVYGDVDLNLLDGSAIWAQSIVDVLADVPDVEVSLLLKAPVRTDRLIRPLTGRPNVTIIRPFEEELLPGLTNSLSPSQAGRAISLLDDRQPLTRLWFAGLASRSTLPEWTTSRADCGATSPTSRSPLLTWTTRDVDGWRR